MSYQNPSDPWIEVWGVYFSCRDGKWGERDYWDNLVTSSQGNSCVLCLSYRSPDTARYYGTGRDSLRTWLCPRWWWAFGYSRETYSSRTAVIRSSSGMMCSGTLLWRYQSRSGMTRQGIYSDCTSGLGDGKSSPDSNHERGEDSCLI